MTSANTRDTANGAVSGANLKRWHIAGLVALLVIILSVPLYHFRVENEKALQIARMAGPATFVGRDACVSCHEEAYEDWKGSDHDLAMDVANDTTVVASWNGGLVHEDIAVDFHRRDGKFLVETTGPSGDREEMEVSHVFGFEPLQQYLIPFPGGRYQSLSVPWDVNEKRWYYLYPEADVQPDEWLHWTRGGQSWNGMCSECHSTNVHKGYDFASRSYETTFSEIDVSCEACHGPGSKHVTWAEIPAIARPEDDNGLLVDTQNLTAREEVELCAYCHSRRTSLGDYDHTAGELLDNMIPRLLDEPLYHADGQILDEVYVYGSFVQSKMYAQGVRCSDCHDVHGVKPLKEGNDLCLQCHQPKTYNTKEHHFHEEFDEGEPSDGWLCTSCHMPGRYYMGIDYRLDHSLRVPRPDLAAELGTPDPCTTCHSDQSRDWVLEAYQKWYGIKSKLHYGEILAAGRQRRPGAEADLITVAEDENFPAIVRSTALSLLQAYPTERATAALIRAMANEEALIRRTALLSVRAIEPEELVRVVAPLLRDPVKGVRMEAARSLAEVPPDLLNARQKEAFDLALKDYIGAMEYSLDAAFAGFNLGNLYSLLGDPEKAEQYHKAAIAVDDGFLPAKVNLAMLYNSQGRNAEAERQLRNALEVDPEAGEVAYSLGLLLAEMEDYEEAAVYLERAAAAGLNRGGRVHYNLALLLQRLGRLDQAEAALLEAVSLEPNNLNYLYAAADHYLKRRKLSEARDIAVRMINAHPSQRIGHDILKLVESLMQGRRP